MCVAWWPLGRRDTGAISGPKKKTAVCCWQVDPRMARWTVLFQPPRLTILSSLPPRMADVLGSPIPAALFRCLLQRVANELTLADTSRPPTGLQHM